MSPWWVGQGNGGVACIVSCGEIHTGTPEASPHLSLSGIRIWADRSTFLRATQWIVLPHDGIDLTGTLSWG